MTSNRLYRTSCPAIGLFEESLTLYLWPWLQEDNYHFQISRQAINIIVSSGRVVRCVRAELSTGRVARLPSIQ